MFVFVFCVVMMFVAVALAVVFVAMALIVMFVCSVLIMSHNIAFLLFVF